MALATQQKEDTRLLVKKFVDNHVDCNQPNSAYIVSSNSVHTLEEAVKKSMERCERVSVIADDVIERDNLISDTLTTKIEALECEE